MVVFESRGDAAGAHGPFGSRSLGGIEGIHVDLQREVAGPALGHFVGEAPLQPFVSNAIP